LSNDTDVDEGTVLSVAAPGTFTGTYGSLALAADGSYTYTLNTAGVQLLAQGESVTDSFSYQATDGITSSNSATLVVTITGVNDPPVANDDAASMPAVPTPRSSDLLSNDTDVDEGTALTVAAPGTFTGTYGSLALAADGSY